MKNCTMTKEKKCCTTHSRSEICEKKRKEIIAKNGEMKKMKLVSNGESLAEILKPQFLRRNFYRQINKTKK